MMLNNKRVSRRLNLWYCGGQAFYFGVFCAVIGYASVFLLHRGFANSQIGMILAAGNLLAVIAQPWLASWSDAHPQIPLSRSVIIMGASMAAVLLLVVFVPMNKLILSVLLVLCIMILMILMALMNSLAFVYEPQGYRINYGVGRGLGSGFYALTSLIIGQMADCISPEIIPIMAVIFATLMTICIIFYRIPKNEMPAQKETVSKVSGSQMSFVQFIKTYRIYTIFLLGIVLVYLGHMFINDFMIQILTPLGATNSDMGTAISFAAILEVPVMFAFSKILKRVKCSAILKFSMVMFLAKHLITYLAVNMTMIYIAQGLQMFAYALMCPACVYYVNEVVNPKDLVKGQSMSNIATTAAGILASMMGGIMLDSVGVHTALLICTVLTGIGVIIVFMTVNKARKQA
ncbi:MAG: MFS transporter [Erysipelotrichia bacterium]|nr:MFS transporter [Erysipelotrichia bacterium]